MWLFHSHPSFSSTYFTQLRNVLTANIYHTPAATLDTLPPTPLPVGIHSILPVSVSPMYKFCCAFHSAASNVSSCFCRYYFLSTSLNFWLFNFQHFYFYPLFLGFHPTDFHIDKIVSCGGITLSLPLSQTDLVFPIRTFCLTLISTSTTSLSITLLYATSEDYTDGHQSTYTVHTSSRQSNLIGAIPPLLQVILSHRLINTSFATSEAICSSQFTYHQHGNRWEVIILLPTMQDRIEGLAKVINVYNPALQSFSSKTKLSTDLCGEIYHAQIVLIIPYQSSSIQILPLRIPSNNLPSIDVPLNGP